MHNVSNADYMCTHASKMLILTCLILPEEGLRYPGGMELRWSVTASAGDMLPDISGFGYKTFLFLFNWLLTLTQHVIYRYRPYLFLVSILISSFFLYFLHVESWCACLLKHWSNNSIFLF